MSHVLLMGRKLDIPFTLNILSLLFSIMYVHLIVAASVVVVEGMAISSIVLRVIYARC